MSPRRPRVPRVDPALTRDASEDAARTSPRRAVAARVGATRIGSSGRPPAHPEQPGAAEARPEAASAVSPDPEPGARPAGRTVDGAPLRTPPSDVAAEPARPSAPERLPEPAPEPAGEVIDLQRVQQRREGAGSRPRRAAPRPARPARGSRAASPPDAAARRRAPLPEPVPARQITGRSLVVVAVLLVAAVLMAPTLRTFLNQQLEIAAAQEDIAQKKRQQAEYETTIRRWDDPAYVAQQARERLDLVMPGETLYTVTGVPQPAPSDVAPEPTPDLVNPRLPWVEGLWDTVVRSSGA